MSAYIVNDETISAIVKGFEIYGAIYDAEGYRKPNSIIINITDLRNSIGQHLLNQNYASVNWRYREDEEPRKFEYVDIPNINPGMILGCIHCYNYQTCEADIEGKDYFESNLYQSLTELEECMLVRYITNDGYEVPWGITSDDIRNRKMEE